MGCGMSQLSLSNRIRVLESAITPSRSTDLPSTSSFSSRISRPSSSQGPSTPVPSIQKAMTIGSSKIAALEGSITTPSVAVKSKAVVSPLFPTAAESVIPSNIPSPAALHHKPSLVSNNSILPANQGSLRSFSDQDSGYKGDDSTPEDLPSESDVTPSPSPRSRKEGEELHGKTSTQSNQESPVENNSNEVKRTADDYQEEPAARPEANTMPQLCSCGFSHAKQDGYVESYDDGYLDSSCEELRGLDGSVFSIDILCHKTIDGSQHYYKVPLSVHKRNGPQGSSGAGSGNSDEDTFNYDKNALSRFQRYPITTSPLDKQAVLAGLKSTYFKRSHSAHSHRRRRILSFDEDPSCDPVIASARSRDRSVHQAPALPAPGIGNHASQYEIKTIAD